MLIIKRRENRTKEENLDSSLEVFRIPFESLVDLPRLHVIITTWRTETGHPFLFYLWGQFSVAMESRYLEDKQKKRYGVSETGGNSQESPK